MYTAIPAVKLNMIKQNHMIFADFSVNFEPISFAKFEENRFRIDGEIAENHAILVNLTASIQYTVVTSQNEYHQNNVFCKCDA